MKMRQIYYRCFYILLFFVVCSGLPAEAKAELSDLVLAPSVSNVSADVSLSGTLTAIYGILNDSAVYSDSQVINSGASGTIKSAINNDLIFWQSNIQTFPNVTLSDSHTMFGFNLALSTTINVLSFQHTGPSDPFAMVPVTTIGLYDIGPQTLELFITLDVTTSVLIQDINHIDQGPISLTLSGQVQLDNDGQPLSYYMAYDGALSFPINGTGGGFGGLTWSFDGEVTITNLAFDLNGSAALAGDFDGDDVPNEVDNCPCTYNPDQSDANQDGIGDLCIFHFFTSDLDKDCDVDAEDLAKMAEEFGFTNLTQGP